MAASRPCSFDVFGGGASLASSSCGSPSPDRAGAARGASPLGNGEGRNDGSGGGVEALERGISLGQWVGGAATPGPLDATLAAKGSLTFALPAIGASASDGPDGGPHGAVTRQNGGGGPRGGHRRTLSVDKTAALFTSTSYGSGAGAGAGAGSHSTLEVEPGVFLLLRVRPGGDDGASSGGGGGSTPSAELRRVRFAKERFSAEEAAAWWAINRAAVLERYGLSLPEQPEPTTSSPEPLRPVRVSQLAGDAGGSGSGGSSPSAMFDVDPFSSRS